jgi:hypothetical protein
VIVLFIIPFVVSLYFARRTTAVGYKNKVVNIIILLGLLISPFFFLIEILSWFYIYSGAIMAYTLLLFYLVLLFYIANLKKKE